MLQILKRLQLLTALATLPMAAQNLSFTAQSVPAGNAPTSIRLIDFNGDGRPDIIVINAGGGGSVSVLLNQGGGNFSAPINTLTAARAPSS